MLNNLVIDCVSGYFSTFKLNVVGGSVLTWHPAGVGHATCMCEGPIS